MIYTDWLRREKKRQENAPISTLTLRWTESGGVRFLDYYISGVSLSAYLGLAEAVSGSDELVSVLGWLPEEENRSQRQMLLGGESPRWHWRGPCIDLYFMGSDDIYDAYQRTLTATRREESGTILWTNFCWQPCCDVPLWSNLGRPPVWKDYFDIPPIRFDTHQYRTVLTTKPSVQSNHVL